MPGKPNDVMHVTIKVVKPPSGRSWLIEHFQDGPFRVETFPRHEAIEGLAKSTQAAGSMPLWSGYRDVYTGRKRAGQSNWRSSNDVRTRQSTGLFYYRLARDLRPSIIVEIGTAFGVSGMYWLAALEDNGKGRLHTFDPNHIWRAIAVENLTTIGTRFMSILGTFEDKHHAALPDDVEIDLAFVDGIHTSEFVHPQVCLLKSRMRAGGLIILDDIRFSKDMFACWSSIAMERDVRASLEITGRVGIIEYGN